MAARPPLTGLKVLEFAGLAPVPFAGMFLADAGADVLRVDRPAASPADVPADELARHKASIAVDLKNPAGVALLLDLADQADVLLDPFRPGVLERLGLGPDVVLARNPRLVYARLGGFRRDGAYHAMAGHDINYLAVSGVLGLLGRAGGPPTPPVNMLGDFAGGGLMAASGILLALLARDRTGQGQVVEANMVDGASYLATFPRYALKTPVGNGARGTNLLDSGSPFYDTYATADGHWMALGALEARFWAIIVDRLQLDPRWLKDRNDRAHWPELRRVLAAAFQTADRDHWERVFAGSDACCTPVLDYAELEAGTASGTREGDQRPPVRLTHTPLRPVTAHDGFHGRLLAPGHGGDDVLHRWRGWSRGVQYNAVNGGLVKSSSNQRSKL